jgi:low affinity Fe/Cu permease
MERHKVDVMQSSKAIDQKNWFGAMAQKTAKLAGSSAAFTAICAITLAWLISGPIFHWSDTWQLVINTVTNIVSMLMVFLIQNTQNRESVAQQLKLDELLRAVRGAQNTFINIEGLTEEELKPIKERYAALAEDARLRGDLAPHSGSSSRE